MSINAGNGTPKEAAEWLEYCNGSSDTPMGRLRAKYGHPKPYNVRVWEIGNELYGDWQIGHTDPKGNAERFVRFRDAMLAVDATIEIISTGKGDEFTGGGLARTNEWNDALLKAARRGNGVKPRYLSLHPLVPLPGDLPKKYSYEEIYWSVMAHPQWWSDTYVPSLQRLIHAEFGPDAKLQLAPTEWGVIIGGPNWLRYPNHDAESGAVYAALFFHAMFRRGDMVGLSNVTALMHGGGIKRPNSVTYVDPMYYVEKLYAEARPERLIPIAVEGPGYDVPERDFLPAAKAVPYLDVLAGEDRQKSRYLFVVNRDMARSRSAHFTLDKAYSRALLQTLSGKPQQGNSLEKPETIKPASSTLPINGKTVEHSFPPCSVTIITLK
jgi:alpha-N-arabinofuranosidase